MTFKLVTWNVNSVRARLDNIAGWLEKNQPDMVLLQEIKCQDEQFPIEPFTDLNYNLVVKGQKAYNGVAILSKEPIELLTDRLPGNEEDQQARFLECYSKGIRIINLYAPNGNPIDDPVKFPYKLAWMQRLIDYVNQTAVPGEPVIIAGDCNVLPTDEDCYNPKNFVKDAVAQPETRHLWRKLLEEGFNDVLLDQTQNPKNYTFWGYRGGCWQKNNGLRLDYFLVNQPLISKITDCYVDRAPRDLTKASDHTPVVLEYSV